MRRLAAVAVLALPLVAVANLRAPGRVEAAPSGALAKPPAALAVKGERLTVRCELEACEVEARYAIDAEQALETALEFVMPGAPARTAPVTATVNGKPRPAAVDPGGSQARFSAPLVAGANEVLVRYRQPLAADEHDYGYFKKGRWVHRFRYEVWPLKGWKLAPGFELALEVSLDRPPPGFFQRHFGTLRSLGCADEAGKKLPATPVQEGERLVLRVAFGPKLPDRLVCEMGDEDLLAP
jgi:hypothetical protein